MARGEFGGLSIGLLGDSKRGDNEMMIYPKPVKVILRKGHFGPGVYDYRYLIRFNGDEYELGSSIHEMETVIRERYDPQAAAVKRTFQYYLEHEYIGKPDFKKAVIAR